MIGLIGGGGGGSIPGLTSDGANGAIVQRALRAGDQGANVDPDSIAFYGSLTCHDTPANAITGTTVAWLTQGQPIPIGGYGAAVLLVSRFGSIADADYSEPALAINDTSGSAQPILSVKRSGVPVLTINAPQTITGALSSVTDPAAQAVLTAIVAALNATSLAADATT